MRWASARLRSSARCRSTLAWRSASSEAIASRAPASSAVRSATLRFERRAGVLGRDQRLLEGGLAQHLVGPELRDPPRGAPPLAVDDAAQGRGAGRHHDVLAGVVERRRQRQDRDQPRDEHQAHGPQEPAPHQVQAADADQDQRDEDLRHAGATDRRRQDRVAEDGQGHGHGDHRGAPDRQRTSPDQPRQRQEAAAEHQIVDGHPGSGRGRNGRGVDRRQGQEQRGQHQQARPHGVDGGLDAVGLEPRAARPDRPRRPRREFDGRGWMLRSADGAHSERIDRFGRRYRAPRCAIG
jgi:hypothetical protein